VEECNELEILEIILQTQRIESYYLDAALFVLIDMGIAEQVEMLLRYGANSNDVYPEKYLGYEGSVSVLQYTLLQTADTTDCKATFEILEWLFKYKADVNWQGSITVVRQQALRAMASDMAQEVHEICFPESDYESHRAGVSYGELLRNLRKPKKPEKIIEYKNLNTPLHVLALTNTYLNQGLFFQLLKNQADINLQNHEGKTPLHILCEVFYQNELGGENTPDIIAALSKTNIKPNIQDKKGNTVLHTFLESFSRTYDYRLKHLFPEVIRNLLRLGVNPTITNRHGQTALQMCDRLSKIYKECLAWDAVILMLSHQADILKPRAKGSLSIEPLGVAVLQPLVHLHLLNSTDPTKVQKPSDSPASDVKRTNHP
jgi:ankyrin repeat protein